MNTRLWYRAFCVVDSHVKDIPRSEGDPSVRGEEGVTDPPHCIFPPVTQFTSLAAPHTSALGHRDEGLRKARGTNRWREPTGEKIEFLKRDTFQKILLPETQWNGWGGVFLWWRDLGTSSHEISNWHVVPVDTGTTVDYRIKPWKVSVSELTSSMNSPPPSRTLRTSSLTSSTLTLRSFTLVPQTTRLEVTRRLRPGCRSTSCANHRRGGYLPFDPINRD